MALLYGTSKHKISTDGADKGYFHMEKLRHREWHSHESVPVVQYGLCSLYVGDTYTLASTDGDIDFCWFSVQSSAGPFEESVLSLHLVLGLHRTVGITQAAVRRVPDISPPSPHDTDFYVFPVDVFLIAP